MLRTRVLTAIVLVPIVLAIILLGEPWLSIMVGALVFLGLAELINLLDAAGYQPPQVMTLLTGTVVTGAGLLVANHDGVSGLPGELLRVTEEGTFEEGRSTLQLPADPEDNTRWQAVRKALLAARAHRPQPERDASRPGPSARSASRTSVSSRHLSR